MAIHQQSQNMSNCFTPLQVVPTMAPNTREVLENGVFSRRAAGPSSRGTPVSRLPPLPLIQRELSAESWLKHHPCCSHYLRWHWYLMNVIRTGPVPVFWEVTYSLYSVAHWRFRLFVLSRR
ncbi:predicted protein [Aspergillus nidulans FGSC A4]|uniref:Uncharacterized protein n=1 Tax=Emericella nidulans (strain FGSC A4 / ATCC 38163 / CBS 112.46 / NRRL 194 / M139) TaxID=227321 RepID=Q5BB77_EMENI|nr:hypothetical protein [Aspergillus nidulans FGSC A4]EAA63860.1 predicted protein [Aspergillus nidulans FGSC A4]CBF86375.1 TPA: conserved hypothetical protein [Aspergillus nidulans FGSC A4]|eukprot:XP_659807.1 predicted protein [Aspergillus nidulans FGSC A4]